MSRVPLLGGPLPVVVGGILTSTLLSLVVGQYVPGVSKVTQVLLKIFVFYFAIVLHEISHGLAAEKRGDPTARALGRITLNPLPHIDLFGTIIIPAFLLITGMFTGSYFIIGWAKPVPIDIRRFREPLVDFGFTALAGPAANGIQVAIYAALYHVSTTLGAPLWVQYLCFVGTAINLFLGLFNLIPIPPLDGSRVVAALLPTNAALAYLSIERFGFMLVFFLLWSGVLNPFYRAVGALLYRILS